MNINVFAYRTSSRTRPSTGEGVVHFRNPQKGEIDEVAGITPPMSVRNFQHPFRGKLAGLVFVWNDDLGYPGPLVPLISGNLLI